MERIGKYEIIRELGRGAMGRVFLGRHPIMEKTVAIKVVHAPGTQNQAELDHLRKRLFDEARRAGALSHPNIVTIYDVDVIDDLAFIVMEYVEGDTLEDRLTPGIAMAFDSTVAIIGQIASALDAAHARSIIHRDIKPANIMLTEGDRVKVADFGIAKNLAESGMTQTGLVLGTPYYMAPELIIGKPIDGRADQFALAVIAYRMLTGVRPFDGETITAIMYQIVNGQPKPMLECNNSLRPPTALIVEKALSKEPGERYATCSEFARALGTGTAPAAVPSPAFVATQVVTGGAAAAAAPALARTLVPPAPAAPAVGAAPVARKARSAARALVYFLLPIVVLAAVAALYLNNQRAVSSAPSQAAPVVQSEPRLPGTEAPKKTEARKPVRRTGPAKGRTAAAKGTAEAAKPEPEVQLIDVQEPPAPKVPRVFDKR